MSICINPNCPNPHNRDTLLFCQSCGSELLIDGRYRTARQLGGGGFSKTYEVIDCTPDSLLDTECRFKVLKALTHNLPKYVELFKREAQVLAQLNHPGIPKVDPDDYFTYQSQNSREPLHCLVMEKIEGLNLLEYATRRGTVIKQKRAIQWLIQLAAILQEVHSHNFFHRDIKPSNIMLRADGQLVLIDFGAARQVTETFMSKQAQGQVTGVISAGYTPPEQMHGQAVPQSDFFALGRTFVFLLTGQEPSEFYDSVSDTLRWREAAADVSPLLADFLDRLMARLPHERPKTAAEILQQLREIYHNLYPSHRSELLHRGQYAPAPPSLVPIAEPTQPLTMPNSSARMPKTATEPLQSANAAADNSQTPSISTSRAGESNFPSSPSPQTGMPLQPEFLSRCQQELAEFIGPMAAIVCQRTLSKNPQLSARELVETLAQKIPNQQQALEFKKRLFNSF